MIGVAGVRFSGTAFMINDYAKPSKTEKEQRPDNWKIELKYDGSRQFLAGTKKGVKLKNKRGRDKTRHFPEITQEIQLPEGTLLDGELIIRDDLHPHGNKHVLHKRDGGKPVIRKSGGKNFKPKLKMKEYPATFVVFDILRYRGKNVRMRELSERRDMIEEIVEEIDGRVMKARRFTDFSTAWDTVIEEKMEGVILKKPGTAYPSGRTTKWQKVKNIKDTVITCHSYEEHSKGITVEGSDEYSDNHRVVVNGAVSSDVKDAINSGDTQVEVSYLERSKNGKLREPTFKRLKQ